MSIERRVVLDFARLATVDQLHDRPARNRYRAEDRSGINTTA